MLDSPYVNLFTQKPLQCAWGVRFTMAWALKVSVAPLIFANHRLSILVILISWPSRGKGRPRWCCAAKIPCRTVTEKERGPPSMGLGKHLPFRLLSRCLVPLSALCENLRPVSDAFSLYAFSRHMSQRFGRHYGPVGS